MKKNGFLKLFVDLLIPNLLAIAAYILLLMLLNLLSEGKLVMSTGALTSQGWDAEDVSPAIRVALNIALLVCSAAVLGLFYFVSDLRLRRSITERDAFLAELGTAPYDHGMWHTIYMKRKGRWSILFFSIVLLTLMTMEELGVPFATLLITPQTLFPHSLVALFPLGQNARRVIIYLLTALLNIGCYTVYQWFFPCRIYDRWAGERMRVDT